MSARVGISLIGTPDGFEAASIGASRSLNVGRKVDLDNSVINILPDTDILAVRKDVEGGRLLTHVTYYRFAREIKTSRTGSFYGCSLLFENFVPGRIPFLLKILEALADRLSDFCIDRSENRFHSHIGPSLLEEVTADGSLLDANAYADGALLLPGHVHDGRCFLLLDRDVPDYGAFLANALLDDPQSPSGLPAYHFVYTSKHATVLEQVWLRRGLKVETLTSLKGGHVGAGSARETPRQPPRPGREERPLATPSHATPQAPAPEHILATRADESSGEPAATSPAAPAPPPVPTSRHEEVSTGSNIEMPVKYRPRSRASETEPSDGRLVTLARLIERPFRSRVFRVGSGGIKLLKVALVAAAAAVGIVLVVYLSRRALMHVTDGSEKTVYYYGCKNETGGSAQATQKCMPDKVAEDFTTRLGNCEQFRDYPDRDRYREKLKEQITKSIANGQTSLSSTDPASFPIKLNFTGGDICLEQIIENGAPDFTLTAPKATPTATPKATATATPTPTNTSGKAGVSSDPRPPHPSGNANGKANGNGNVNANGGRNGNMNASENANTNGNRDADANRNQAPNVNQTPRAQGNDNSNTVKPVAPTSDDKKQTLQAPANTETPRDKTQPRNGRGPLKQGKKGVRTRDDDN